MLTIYTRATTFLTAVPIETQWNKESIDALLHNDPLSTLVLEEVASTYL